MNQQHNEFEMDVRNVFSFADGRTVLVGTIEDGPAYIGKQRCELVVDGVRTRVIEIEGEMISDQTELSDLRSISTRDRVSVNRALLTSSSCRLRTLAPTDALAKERLGKSA